MTTLKEFEKWWESQYGEAMQFRDWQTCGNLIIAKPWQEDGFVKGYEKGRRDLIEAASDGFEWWYISNDKDFPVVKNQVGLRQFNFAQLEKAWIASKLSSAKKIKELERENREMREALGWATNDYLIQLEADGYTMTNRFEKAKEIRQRFGLDKEGA